MSKLQEILAIPLEEKFRRDQFAIHNAKQAPGNVNPDRPLRFGIKGESEPNEFKSGLAYKFWGTWENNPQYGPSFSFSSFSVTSPHGKTGIISYLKQCRHIGDAIAYALWESFAGDAVKILREQPDRAAAAVGPRFPPARAREAAEDLQYMVAAENVTIELHDLLDGRGFGKGAVRTYLRAFGAKAVETLRRDPYKAQIARGVGWKKADAFYLDLGKDPAALKRQALCLSYVGLKEAEQEGHVWCPLESAIAGLKASIGGTQVTPEKALMLACRAKVVKLRTDDKGVTWIADIRRANAEQYVAERIIDMMYAAQIGPPLPEWESRTETVITKPDHTRCTRCHRKLTAAEVWILSGQPYGPDCIQKADPCYELSAEQVLLADWLTGQSEVTTIVTRQLVGATRLVSAVEWPSMDRREFADLSDHQREKLSAALASPLGVLSGKPGSGKTYTLSRLVKAIIAQHGLTSVCVCCPTGKAAVRCKETLAGAGCSDIDPKTIHRTLGVASSEDGWTFMHNEQNPLSYRFIIVDEASMIGLGLLRSLLAATARGTGVLFVGDVCQLPPVEFGAPLRDMVAAGVPTGILTEIRRNSGLIVKTCSAIVDGLAWQPASKIDLKAEDPVNLCLIPAGKYQAASKVCQLVEQLRDLSPWNVLADVMVLAAVNKKSPVSRVELNRLLQPIMNPNGQGVPNSPFRTGDRVIQLKNGFLPLAIEKEDRKTGVADWGPDSDSKVMVANGDIGSVLFVAEKKTVVKFDNDRTVIVFRGTKQKDEEDGAANGAANGDDDKSDTGCDLVHAWCISTHKSQGSQFPIVIYVIDEYPGASGQFGVVDKSHFYTGISRAMSACFLVGQKHIADSVCSRSFINRRKTFTVELLQELAKKAGVQLTPPIVKEEASICSIGVRRTWGWLNPPDEPGSPAMIEEAALW